MVPVENQYRDPEILEARIRLHREFSTAPQPWAVWVFDHLLRNAPPSARVLEIGAGTGALWSRNSARVPGGWRVLLTDPSAGMAAALRIAPGAHQVARADAAHLPVASSVCDVVIANHMIYHARDRPAAIAEFARVLHPGGVLLATTNGGEHLRELDEVSGGALGARVHEAFGLENGAGQLRSSFAGVRRVRFPDSLEVTDAAAVVDYVRSTGVADSRRLEQVRRSVQRRIDERGAYTVRKSSGLFLCRAPHSSAHPPRHPR